MTKMRKRKIKKTMFYIRRGLIRWAVMLGGTLGVICMAVFLMEDPNSRIVLEAAIGFWAALCLANWIYKLDGGDNE